MPRRTKAERMNSAVEQALFQKATGYTYTQQDSCKVKHILYTESGKKAEEKEELETVTVQKYVPPEYSAIALWLKARLPQKWGDAAQDTPPNVVPILDDIPPCSLPAADVPPPEDEQTETADLYE